MKTKRGKKGNDIRLARKPSQLVIHATLGRSERCRMLNGKANVNLGSDGRRWDGISGCWDARPDQGGWGRKGEALDDMGYEDKGHPLSF